MPRFDSMHHVALALADTWLAGTNTPVAMEAGALAALGRSWPWLKPLCRAIHRRSGGLLHAYGREELAQLIMQHAGFRAAWEDHTQQPPQIVRYCLQRPQPAPVDAGMPLFTLPKLANCLELARYLLLTPTELDWYADHWRHSANDAEPLQHYRYRWLAKRHGGVRLLEIPKPRLRELQVLILRGLLNQVTPHPAAQGFRRGASIRTHAAVHVGQAAVLRMDLQDFFSGIAYARVHALFAKLGYTPTVARALAGLCCHRTRPTAYAALEREQRPNAQQQALLRNPHLPQGAPTSPALANLCAFRLDVRLSALAAAVGARYTRYADDLTFSGGADFSRCLPRLQVQVAAICLEEGFAVQPRKTRVMRRSARQTVTGIVVNQRLNICRNDYDALKATLYNCVHHGPASQNREQHADFRAHLRGKVAYVQSIHAQRGQRLLALLEQIVWD